MAWKYKVGLILLVAVVVIWVTSAEITQVCSCTSTVFNSKFYVDELHSSSVCGDVCWDIHVGGLSCNCIHQRMHNEGF
uniref:Uncharacterized protein n=1 Tax=Cucumis sativus TaxID=3659 RepID=A0A0A0LTK2_CUCSA